MYMRPICCCIRWAAPRGSVSQRMLRVGSVDFDTAGSAEFNFSFRGVSHPRQIVRTVDRALRALRSDQDPQADASV